MAERNQKVTLRDVMEKLEQQERRTVTAIYLAGSIFGASVALTPWAAALSRVTSTLFFNLCYWGMSALGCAFFFWCQYKWHKYRKSKD